MMTHDLLHGSVIIQESRLHVRNNRKAPPQRRISPVYEGSRNRSNASAQHPTHLLALFLQTGAPGFAHRGRVDCYPRFQIPKKRRFGAGVADWGGGSMATGCRSRAVSGVQYEQPSKK